MTDPTVSETDLLVLASQLSIQLHAAQQEILRLQHELDLANAQYERNFNLRKRMLASQLEFNN